MGSDIFLLPGIDELIGITHSGKVIGDIRHRVGLHLDIRHDAAAVADNASVERLKRTGQRVSNDLCPTRRIVLVVDFLNTTARRDIIFVRCHLHLSIVRQIHDRLYEPLYRKSLCP